MSALSSRVAFMRRGGVLLFGKEASRFHLCQTALQFNTHADRTGLRCRAVEACTQGVAAVADETSSKEAQVLRMVKRVLTDIAKDTSTPPGVKHPLSDHTLLGIRECLALISARERELAEEVGQPMNMRPRFTDEPKKTVVVPIDQVGRGKRSPGDAD